MEVQSSSVIQWRVPKWFPQLSADQLGGLQKYHQLLLKYNQTINLISARTEAEADKWHFADSILGWGLVKKHQPSFGEDPVYDLGSGNGFPGLVASILDRQTRFVLIDSDTRKTEFLKIVKAELQLQHVEVKSGLIEQLPPQSIKFALSRAFANLTKSCLVTRKLFKPQGLYFHWKSEEWAKEVAEMPTSLCAFWLPKHLGGYKLPDESLSYHIVVTQRLNKE